MEEMRLFDINSTELRELISDGKIKLKKRNLEYKKLTDEVSKILEDYPNLQLILEDNTTLILNENECKMLQKLVELNVEITTIEEREIFFLGGRELYFYLKNMNLIKE